MVPSRAVAAANGAWILALRPNGPEPSWPPASGGRRRRAGLAAPGSPSIPAASPGPIDAKPGLA